MNVTTDLWKYTKNSLVLQQDNFTTNVTARLQKFEDDLIYAIKRKGWDGEEDTKIQQWTFTGALFYSIIVITTIGEYSQMQLFKFILKYYHIIYAHTI